MCFRFPGLEYIWPDVQRRWRATRMDISKMKWNPMSVNRLMETHQAGSFDMRGQRTRHRRMMSPQSQSTPDPTPTYSTMHYTGMSHCGSESMNMNALTSSVARLERYDKCYAVPMLSLWRGPAFCGPQSGVGGFNRPEGGRVFFASLWVRLFTELPNKSKL